MKGQFAILRQRTFRHLFLAQAVSWLGTAIAPVALAFAILGQPGGTATDARARGGSAAPAPWWPRCWRAGSSPIGSPATG